MINRLLLTTNAYFYKVKKKISKAAITKIFVQASSSKDGHALYNDIRHSLNVGGEDFKVSLIVFKREVPPTFLVRGKEMEIHYNFLFLVEYDHFLIISKKGTDEFMDIIEKKVTYLSYQEVTGLKITPTTQFTKVGVTNMDTAASAMRRTSWEAPDVKTLLSPLATSNKIVTSLKLKDKGRNTSVAPGTSRINDLGKRRDVTNFCYWAAAQCKDIDRFTPKNTYLNNFAEPLDFRTHIKDLKVVSILFNLSPILEGLEDQSISGIYFLDKNARSRDIDLKLLTENHDFCMAVLYKKGAKSCPIQNSFDNTLSLRQLTEGFAIRSDKLDRINILYTTGEGISLLDLINRDHLYVISFNHSDIRFSGRTLFKDSRLLNDIPLFLQSFETQAFLSTVKSEKGNCTSASRKFDSGSLFNLIESRLSGDCSYLFCDDLGNEWADYIGFKENQFIRFYHAKYSNKQFSASAFQDLVSQALKNLGNFNFNQNLDAKKAKINKSYSGTKIKRLRKGSAVKTFMKELETTFNHPKTVKEVALVINFLSKGELQGQMKLLSKGKAKKETVQILWLLSSLFSECLQRGVIPTVITKP